MVCHRLFEQAETAIRRREDRGGQKRHACRPPFACFDDSDSGRHQLHTGQHLHDQFTGLNTPDDEHAEELAQKIGRASARPTS